MNATFAAHRNNRDMLIMISLAYSLSKVTVEFILLYWMSFPQPGRATQHLAVQLPRRELHRLPIIHCSSSRLGQSKATVNFPQPPVWMLGEPTSSQSLNTHCLSSSCFGEHSRLPWTESENFFLFVMLDINKTSIQGEDRVKYTERCSALAPNWLWSLGCVSYLERWREGKGRCCLG